MNRDPQQNGQGQQNTDKIDAARPQGTPGQNGHPPGNTAGYYRKRCFSFQPHCINSGMGKQTDGDHYADQRAQSKGPYDTNNRNQSTECQGLPGKEHPGGQRAFDGSGHLGVYIPVNIHIEHGAAADSQEQTHQKRQHCCPICQHVPCRSVSCPAGNQQQKGLPALGQFPVSFQFNDYSLLQIAHNLHLVKLVKKKNCMKKNCLKKK